MWLEKYIQLIVLIIILCSGDDRVNQNTGVTVLQVLMLREHNRVCDELLQLNPHWDDETIYQEARRVVVAEVQRITYDAYLPVILGRLYTYSSFMTSFTFVLVTYLLTTHFNNISISINCIQMLFKLSVCVYYKFVKVLIQTKLKLQVSLN